MKIYISADIEGITGVTNWDETLKSKADYPKFAEQMTREVAAACEGANNAGAKEIWVKDAHGSARNLDILGLPENSRIIRGWSRHPFLMMQELDETFDAAIMIGYHTYAGANGNPLAHTLEDYVNYIKINDVFASEFLINTYTAALVGVPVIFVSGDEHLCSHVKNFNENITTLAVKKGSGDSVTAIHPGLAARLTTEGIRSALENNVDKCRIALPEKFKVEISFIQHVKAYRASFYPGMKQISPNTVLYESNNYFDVLSMLLFTI
jgi:D-amino peptidase